MDVKNGLHLQEKGHVVDPDITIITVSRNRGRKLLTIFKAHIILLRNPGLCEQKWITQSVDMTPLHIGL